MQAVVWEVLPLKNKDTRYNNRAEGTYVYTPLADKHTPSENKVF